MWNFSGFCLLFLRMGHAGFLYIVPILMFVLPKRVQDIPHFFDNICISSAYVPFCLEIYSMYGMVEMQM